MNKILWAYNLKKTSNDEEKAIESSSTWIFIAARTGLFDNEDVEMKFQNKGLSSNSRQQTYPPNGKLELFQSWTGEPLHQYRGDLVLPQTMSFYKYPQLCLFCLGPRKKPGKGWDDRIKTTCTADTCPTLAPSPFICVFSDEPSFSVRGLCKDAVMDTQYKFADHESGPFGRGKDDYRSFVGPKGWIISRNKTDKKWRMTHYHYTDLSLTLLASDALPVGRHKWLVENNVCQEGKTSTEILQVSGCEEEQFTCDDGKCLQMSQRCNNIEVRT